MNSCSNHNTLSIGHRGAKGYVAENTYESISKAIELGVDGIEIDIFQCKSGELVLFHDKDLQKLTGKSGKIEDLTIEELESFLGCRVHLFCQIKVREKWLNEAERYSEMGLDFNDGN